MYDALRQLLTAISQLVIILTILRFSCYNCSYAFTVYLRSIAVLAFLRRSLQFHPYETIMIVCLLSASNVNKGLTRDAHLF